ncbi:MAG: M20 family metallopeptidase [Paracoccaceae bacterium]
MKGNSKYLNQEFISKILIKLVQTPSENPGSYEENMVHAIKRFLEETPVEMKVIESMPGRYSIGAILKGNRIGPRLILNGHMDTVPVDDFDEWTKKPFGADILNGFLYGRGACDMKAGLAVQISLAYHFSQYLNCLNGELVFHFAAGEERAEPGTLSLLKSGFGGDFGIVTEPTDLKIATATRGLAPIHIRLMGKSIHASRSHLGINPAWDLSWVLTTLENYKTDLEKYKHPLLGSGSCTPTMVQGGVVPNAVSDFVDLYVDRRLIPGETVEGEIKKISKRLMAAKPSSSKVKIKVDAAYNRFEPAEISNDATIVGLLKTSTKNILGSPSKIYGAPYSSDVRNLVNDAGIDAVNFGPGNVEECHCADERVELKKVSECSLIISDLIEKLMIKN